MNNFVESVENLVVVYVVVGLVIAVDVLGVLCAIRIAGLESRKDDEKMG